MTARTLAVAVLVLLWCLTAAAIMTGVVNLYR